MKVLLRFAKPWANNTPLPTSRDMSILRRIEKKIRAQDLIGLGCKKMSRGRISFSPSADFLKKSQKYFLRLLGLHFPHRQSAYKPLSVS
jgi:hypothetical protein